ncbi:flagellar M-ring protein FliF [Arthrobacter sp. CAU 1506]|uniref:flagellar basal-body MS-ring/collar protein FliF n=1 Tax=Arthrobacter sp. CAU 1506 TaxID=2560052 RepID=UPI0010AC3C29|nr:flagellar basal-body MS-ring/collar protein FliF [Arthrobacter sp. CAU 1506]TJY71503.1 flagellar M-ring protein FliF [Arthrobacter sp. CAU 1506]
MPATVSSWFSRLGKTIREFTVAQRTIAIIGIAVVVLGIAALTAWASKPSYTPLFSGLAAADANTIVEQLRTDGVPYELTNGGGTILVPEQNVYDQRLKAASAGLPSSSTGGYSLLDDMGVTSSEFQQSVTYKRALEGELANTIQALDGVKTASVRLAIPEETVFVSEKGEPTASVFVDTERTTLSADQVQAIVHLTSASIDGMKPENVAVIDAAGTVLSAVGVGATGSADKQASDYEERVRASVQTMLDRVVGPGNSSVVVAADMNYESAERVEETFTTPDGAPALNESTQTEDYTGSGGGAAGVLGPDNIAVPGNAAGDGTFTSESETKNNALNKVTETRAIPAGAINRQTVSVALDADAAGALNLANIEGLVTTAAGINADRGDEVTVELVPFNTAGAQEAAEALAAAQAAEEAARQAELIRTAIITAGIVLLVIIALLVYARWSRRQNREPVDLGELQDFQPEIEAPVDLQLPAPKPVIVPEPIPVVAPSTTALELTGPPELSDEQKDMNRKRAEIDALAAQEPDKTADFLRSLMDEKQNA